MTLGEKIRKYRTLNGLTQAQLGAMVKLTGDRIRQYEKSVRKPKEGKLTEIAEALHINPTALLDPDLCNPNSALHMLFELEDIYGLRFEKAGDAYQIVFSQSDDCQDSSWLTEGIAAWTAKRNELQPDIDDSPEALTDKKEKYALWKARYPYPIEENMREYAVLDNAPIADNEIWDRNFPEDRKTEPRPSSADAESMPPEPGVSHSILTFSDFFRSLLTLDAENVSFHIAIDKVADKQSAVLTVNLDCIMNASVSAQKAYVSFRKCWQEMQKYGIEIAENPLSMDGSMHIIMHTFCPQLITLFEEYEKLQKEKASYLFDENAYQMKVEDLARTFDVPVWTAALPQKTTG